MRGEKWLLSEDGADNHFYDVILSPGSNTDLRLASLVPVSRTNSGLCLYLQYKKYSPGNKFIYTKKILYRKYRLFCSNFYIVSICFSFSQYNTRNMIFQGGIEQPLHILAWPYRAVAPQKVNIALTNYWFKLKKLLKVTILSDQANWTSVEVSLSNIYSSFLLIFKFSNSHPTDLAYLGLDSTRVTLGTCSG